MEFYLFDTPLGQMALGEEEGAICRLYLPGRPTPRLMSHPTPLLLRAREQLEEYLAGQRRQFDLPLAPRGTPFQMRVWQQLQRIPYGRTCSYRDLAGAGTGDDAALAALFTGGLQQAFILQRLNMIADGCGGAQAHCRADLPDGGGVAVLLHELIHIFQDPVCFVTGSGHRNGLLDGIFVYYSTYERKRKEVFSVSRKFFRSHIVYCYEREWFYAAIRF